MSLSKEGLSPPVLKFVLVGESGTGKSSLLLRFVEDSFSASFIATIGIDFKVKQVVLSGKKVKIQVWDTAGQERFKTITKAYYRGAEAIILVYDTTDKHSFNKLENWIGDIEGGITHDPIRILVGNKCDMAEMRQIQKEEGEQFASLQNFYFFETSSLTGENVETMFMWIAQEVFKKKTQKDEPTEGTIPKGTIHLEYPKEEVKENKKKDCC